MSRYRKIPAFIISVFCSIIALIAIFFFPISFYAPIVDHPGRIKVFTYPFILSTWLFGLIGAILVPTFVWKSKIRIPWWTYPFILITFLVIFIIFLAVFAHMGWTLRETTRNNPWTS
jgi:H+/Cl- antiporter ClcA